MASTRIFATGLLVLCWLTTSSNGVVEVVTTGTLIWLKNHSKKGAGEPGINGVWIPFPRTHNDAPQESICRGAIPRTSSIPNQQVLIFFDNPIDSYVLETPAIDNCSFIAELEIFPMKCSSILVTARQRHCKSVNQTSTDVLPCCAQIPPELILSRVPLHPFLR